MMCRSFVQRRFEITFEPSKFRRRLSQFSLAIVTDLTRRSSVCQGIVVMGKAFSSPSTGGRIQPSRIPCDADHPDSDLDPDVVSLLEENARLRALVTQLSDLVLRHVVGQK
jgi:hypothetical protein